MRLDLVRAPAISLRHITGKDRITVVMIYPLCKDLEAARLLPVSFFPRKMLIASRHFRTHRDARLAPIEAPRGRDTGAGRQILPGEGGMDGFFYALLHKTR
jgi:hypothetical protein